QLDGLADVVALQASTETAPRHLSVEMNLFSFKPGYGRGPRDQEQRNLRSGPYVQPSVPELDHHVHRFQRRMGEIRHLVFGLDAAGGRDRGLEVTLVLEAAILLSWNEGGRHCLKHCRSRRRVGGRSPIEFDQACGPESAPSVVGDHADATGD